MRQFFTLSLILIALVVMTISVGSASRQPTLVFKDQKKVLQPDIPGTVDGSRKPTNIPDYVAYELLFRSLATSNSLTFAKKTGVRKEEAENLLREARTFGESISRLDAIYSQIKEQATNGELTQENVMRLTSLQQQAAEYVGRVRNSLPKYLGDAAASKLQVYIDDEVKRKIKRIPIEAIRQAYNAPISSIGEESSLYTYADSWYEDATIYGVSAAMSDYLSLNKNGYQATTSVIAPDGKRYVLHHLNETNS